MLPKMFVFCPCIFFLIASSHEIGRETKITLCPFQLYRNDIKILSIAIFCQKIIFVMTKDIIENNVGCICVTMINTTLN